jgi:hypothetical protein
MHLIVYMKSMIIRLLKNLNNKKSCIPLDASTLNRNYKTNRINFILNGDDFVSHIYMTKYIACRIL